MEAAAPLINKYSPLAVPPFILNEKFYDTLAEGRPIDSIVQQSPSWTFARKRTNGEMMPQTIAHRGYKAKHPENTMGAFIGAIKAKASAIETDIHLTKDNVAVLSHDATLKRCYGKDEKIADCSWDYISKQRTLEEPHEPMPRLLDLLQFLATPGLEDIWLLLDIKLNNDADTVMRIIAETIKSVQPNTKAWDQRIVLGCWARKYFTFCNLHLPTFTVSFIGFSSSYARQFLSVPNMSFNMLQKTLMYYYFGGKFLQDAKAKGRPVFVWTVNEESMMKWSIREKVDAVITDDPKRFLEACEDWEHGRRKIDCTWSQWLGILWINLMVLVFDAIFWWRNGGEHHKKDEIRESGSTIAQ